MQNKTSSIQVTATHPYKNQENVTFQIQAAKRWYLSIQFSSTLLSLSRTKQTKLEFFQHV